MRRAQSCPIGMWAASITRSPQFSRFIYIQEESGLGSLPVAEWTAICSRNVFYPFSLRWPIVSLRAKYKNAPTLIKFVTTAMIFQRITGLEAINNP